MKAKEIRVLLRDDGYFSFQEFASAVGPKRYIAINGVRDRLPAKFKKSERGDTWIKKSQAAAFDRVLMNSKVCFSTGNEENFDSDPPRGNASGRASGHASEHAHERVSAGDPRPSILNVQSREALAAQQTQDAEGAQETERGAETPEAEQDSVWFDAHDHPPEALPEALPEPEPTQNGGVIQETLAEPEPQETDWVQQLKDSTSENLAACMESASHALASCDSPQKKALVPEMLRAAAAHSIRPPSSAVEAAARDPELAIALLDYSQCNVPAAERLAIWKRVSKKCPHNYLVWTRMFGLFGELKLKKCVSYIKRGLHALFVGERQPGCHVYFDKVASWLASQDQLATLLELTESIRDDREPGPELAEALLRAEDLVFAPPNTYRARVLTCVNMVWHDSCGKRGAICHDMKQLCDECGQYAGPAELVRANNARVLRLLVKAINFQAPPTSPADAEGCVALLELLIEFSRQLGQDDADLEALYNTVFQQLLDWRLFSARAVESFADRGFKPHQRLLDLLDAQPASAPEAAALRRRVAPVDSARLHEHLAADPSSAERWLEMGRALAPPAARNLMCVALEYVEGPPRRAIWAQLYELDPAEEVLAGWLGEFQDPGVLMLATQAVFERERSEQALFI